MRGLIHCPDVTREATEAEVRAAQEQVLETRASYVLRNEVVESVMSVNPVLKAVHNATNSSPIER